MGGRLRCVSTSITPATDSASLASMRAMRPLAIVDVTTLACARPGVSNSPAYFAAPVTLARPSTRDVAVPMSAVMGLLLSPDFLIGLRLRSAGRSLRQRTDNSAAREIDLKRVVLEALG